MLYNQPKLPLKNCASCRGRACPARSLPPYPVSPSPPCRGRACPARSLPQYSFYGSIRRGGIHPSRTPSHRRKRPRRPEGWPPYTPTSNPCVGRGALTPPRFTAYPVSPSPPCRGRACPARSLPQYSFYGSIRRGGIHPSRTPSHRRKRPRRPEGWPPYTPTSNPCVGRGALTLPKPAAPYMHHLYISLNLFIFL